MCAGPLTRDNYVDARFIFVNVYIQLVQRTRYGGSPSIGLNCDLDRPARPIDMQLASCCVYSCMVNMFYDGDSNRRCSRSRVPFESIMWISNKTKLGGKQKWRKLAASQTNCRGSTACRHRTRDIFHNADDHIYIRLTSPNGICTYIAFLRDRIHTMYLI